MSLLARMSRVSPPSWLALVALLQLAGMAAVAGFPPGDAPASTAAVPAVLASPLPLRIGVAASPSGEMPGMPRFGTGDSSEFELGERLAAGLGRPVRFVPIDLAQRARALEAGRIDVFVGRFDARPVPAGVDVVLGRYRAGLGVAMRADNDPGLLAAVSQAMAGTRQPVASVALAGS